MSHGGTWRLDIFVFIVQSLFSGQVNFTLPSLKRAPINCSVSDHHQGAWLGTSTTAGPVWLHHRLVPSSFWEPCQGALCRQPELSVHLHCLTPPGQWNWVTASQAILRMKWDIVYITSALICHCVAGGRKWDRTESKCQITVLQSLFMFYVYSLGLMVFDTVYHHNQTALSSKSCEIVQSWEESLNIWEGGPWVWNFHL